MLRGFSAREILYVEEPACPEEKEVAREFSRVFRRAEFLGFRDELLGEMVEEYKYQAVRGMSETISEMAFLMYFRDILRGVRRRSSFRGDAFRKDFLRGDSRLLRGGAEAILVPMPTSRKHVRERGFDHMMLVARGIEKRSRGRIQVIRLLERARDTVQVGASDEVREMQAKEAVRANLRFFEEEVRGGSDSGRSSNSGRFLKEIRETKVVLLDDVWTTGASMMEAGRILKAAGIEEVYGLTIVRNRRGASPVIRGGEMVGVA